GVCRCPHHTVFRWVVLVVGVLFLLRDFGWLGGWDFWGVQWWTAVFLLVGLGVLCKCCDSKFL
ncbi:MAG: hypothetical protein AABX55_02730, partial [Nanoarchaeota archaeon]